MLAEAFLAVALALSAPAAGSRPADPGFHLVADDKALSAAVEHFEELTEKAFKSEAGKLAKRLARAEAALAEVRSGLPALSASEADARLAEAKAAQAADNRSDLAIASIEVYRILVSAIASTPERPVEVSLLDYAGFRYDADLKSEPRRWEDMGTMVAYARARWSEVRARVADARLVQRFEASLAAMDEAVGRRDPTLASRSVKDELELVDDLERYFRKD